LVGMVDYFQAGHYKNYRAIHSQELHQSSGQ